MSLEVDGTVDARGRACPVPILELARAIRRAVPGACIRLLATDPAAAADVQAFCESTGHRLEQLSTGSGEVEAWVRVRHGNARPAGSE